MKIKCAASIKLQILKIINVILVRQLILEIDETNIVNMD